MATGQTVAGPAYGAGMPFDRVNSVDTMTSAKSEKRRSFFGLGGKKDKDKDKVMEHEVSKRVMGSRCDGIASLGG
jgi:hypothetical protein